MTENNEKKSSYSEENEIKEKYNEITTDYISNLNENALKKLSSKKQSIINLLNTLRKNYLKKGFSLIHLTKKKENPIKKSEKTKGKLLLTETFKDYNLKDHELNIYFNSTEKKIIINSEQSSEIKELIYPINTNDFDKAKRIIETKFSKVFFIKNFYIFL